MTEALTLPRTDFSYQQRMRLSETEKLSRPDFLRSLRKVGNFTRVFGGIKLRAYQQAAANAIVQSVLHNQGLSIWCNASQNAILAAVDHFTGKF